MTNNMKKVKRWIINNYIDNQTDSTIKEISEGTGLSQSTVSKYVWELTGLDIICTEVEKPVQSRSYPGITIRHIRVQAFGPSRSKLARIIYTKKMLDLHMSTREGMNHAEN